MAQPLATRTDDRSKLRGVATKVRTHGLKYSAVSVINVVLGQSLLFGFHNLANLNPWVANLLAVSISAVPAYYLTRAWVWGKRGRSDLAKEVLPFWGFALAGLLLSTASVWAASKVSTGAIVPNLANIAAFGVLWVVKFFILDAFIFGKHLHAEPGTDPIL